MNDSVEKKVRKLAQEIAEQKLPGIVDKMENDLVTNQVIDGLVNNLKEYGIDVDIIDVRTKAGKAVKISTREVYDEKTGRRLFVVKTNDGWKLVDSKNNVYFTGTSDEIVNHIDRMVEKGKYEVRTSSMLEDDDTDVSKIIQEITAKVKLTGRAKMFFENFAMTSYLAQGEMNKVGMDDSNLEYDLSMYKYPSSDVSKIRRAWRMFKDRMKKGPEREGSLMEVDIQSPKYTGTIKISNIKIDDGIVTSFEYDDSEIRKAYDVAKFQVIIPGKGRYLVDAVNDKIAAEQAIRYVYKDTGLSSTEYARLVNAEQLGDLKVEKIQNQIEEQKSVTKNPVVVVHQEKEVVQNRKESSEKDPEWLKPIKNELVDEIDRIAVSNLTSSIKKEIAGIVQEEFDELELPVTVTEVDLDKNSIGYEADGFSGSFVFDSEIKDGSVISVKASLDNLKGIFGVKEFEITIGDRVFRTEAKDEKTAVRKVLYHLENQGEQLTWEGKNISASYISEDIIDKIATEQTKVIKLYESGDKNLEHWTIMEKDGKSYFVRK